MTQTDGVKAKAPVPPVSVISSIFDKAISTAAAPAIVLPKLITVISTLSPRPTTYTDSFINGFKTGAGVLPSMK